MKAHVAIHKTTGEVWKGKRSVYDCTVGIRAAMDAAFAGSHDKGRPWRELYDIVAYELIGGVIDVEKIKK